MDIANVSLFRFMPDKKKFRKRLWKKLCYKAGYSY